MAYIRVELSPQRDIVFPAALLQDEDLTPYDLRVLLSFYAFPDLQDTYISNRELSGLLRICTGQIHASLKKLVSKDFLTRERASSNRPFRYRLTSQWAITNPPHGINPGMRNEEQRPT